VDLLSLRRSQLWDEGPKPLARKLADEKAQEWRPARKIDLKGRQLGPESFNQASTRTRGEFSVAMGPPLGGQTIDLNPRLSPRVGRWAEPIARHRPGCSARYCVGCLAIRTFAPARISSTNATGPLDPGDSMPQPDLEACPAQAPG